MAVPPDSFLHDFYSVAGWWPGIALLAFALHYGAWHLHGSPFQPPSAFLVSRCTSVPTAAAERSTPAVAVHMLYSLVQLFKWESKGSLYSTLLQSHFVMSVVAATVVMLQYGLINKMSSAVSRCCCPHHMWSISQATTTRCPPTGPACHTSCCHCCTGCNPSSPYAAAWCRMMQLLVTGRLPLWQAASAQLLLLSPFLSSLTACSIATQETPQLVCCQHCNACVTGKCSPERFSFSQTSNLSVPMY